MELRQFLGNLWGKLRQLHRIENAGQLVVSEALIDLGVAVGVDLRLLVNFALELLSEVLVHLYDLARDEQLHDVLELCRVSKPL